MTENEMIDKVAQEGVSPVPAKATASQGVLDTIKENLSPDTLIEKIKASKTRLFEVALYGGIGFISGFLLKKYSVFVGICILLIIGLGVLQHYGALNIVINWDRVNEIFGIQATPTTNMNNIIAVIWGWAKANTIISISYVVGFLIGFSVA